MEKNISVKAFIEGAAKFSFGFFLFRLHKKKLKVRDQKKEANDQRNIRRKINGLPILFLNRVKI
jgi:hypothetical protein